MGENLSQERKGVGGIKLLVGGWAGVVCAVVLVVVAGVHRWQLDLTDPGVYRSSLLVTVEVGLIVVLAVLVLMQVVWAICLTVRGRWWELGSVAGLTVVSVSCFVAALQIDAPTLLYRT